MRIWRSVAILMLVLLYCSPGLSATLVRKESSDYGTTYWARFDNAPFPAKGFSYKDNTVALFVPKHYCPFLIKATPKKKKAKDSRLECYSESQLKQLKKDGYNTSVIKTIDYVVHFHGHSNTVEKALNNHKLREQFSLSLQNGILIVPQGPVNSIDSAAGKLESGGGFKNLMNEAHKFLIQQGVIPKKARIGHIIITSHSGGFRAAAFCVKIGGIEVSEVFLFDSLYGNVDSFYDWIKKSKKHRFISVYYRDKPRARSLELMKMLRIAGIKYRNITEAEMTKESFERKSLAKYQIIFVETDLGHSGCTRGYFNYRDYLFSSGMRRVRSTDWFKKTGLDKMNL